jgi:hypothetical protein
LPSVKSTNSHLFKNPPLTIGIPALSSKYGLRPALQSPANGSLERQRIVYVTG